jgi:hypothetical protein
MNMNRPLSSNRWGFRIALGIVCGAAVMALSPTRAQAADLVPEGSAVTKVVRVGSYDPSEVYKGSHEPQRVYQLVQGPQTWKPNRRPTLVREVTCRDARRALEQQGVRTGWLTQNGSCKSGDDTQWATGNYLNFQAGPQATDADL